MAQHSELTTRSIRFSGCVGVGLVMSIVQGIPALEIAQAALLASTLFLALMVGEAVKARFTRKKKKKITL